MIPDTRTCRAALDLDSEGVQAGYSRFRIASGFEPVYVLRLHISLFDVRTYVRMRWDEQRVENDLRLPGVGDGTTVRTFDAPEAMGVNFHEVHARSALNRVPGGRYGFNWTINHY